MPHLLHPYKLVMGGDIAPVVQSNFALSANDFDSLSSTSTMPTGGSISRVGNAMVTDSSGKLTWAANNQALNSQDIYAGTWNIYGGGSRQGNNVAVAPDGTTTADAMRVTTAGTGSNVYLNPTLNAGTYIWSIYVMRNAASDQTFALLLNVGGTSTVSADFTATSTWQRFYVVGSGPSGSSVPGIIGNSSGTQADILVWGAQLEAVTYQTTPSTYVATTTAAYYGPRLDYYWNGSAYVAKGLLVEGAGTNILPYSNDFSNAAWTKSGITVASGATSPDGTTNGWTTTNTTTTTGLYRGSPVSVSANTVYAASVYLKQGTARYGYLVLVIGSSRSSILVDLQTGTLTNSYNTPTPLTGVSSSITSVGNGWYRLSVSGSNSSVGSGAFLVVQNSNSSTPTVNTGTDLDITSQTNGATLNVFGAQIEQSAFPTSYIPTTAASVSRAAETLSLANYQNRLVEAFYIDEQTGVSSRALTQPSATSPVTISGLPWGWLTSLRAYTNGYAGDPTLPAWLSVAATGNRMYYDSTGYLTWAAANLVERSEDFSYTGAADQIWTKVNATVSADQIASPINTNTADLILESSATAYHGLYGSVSAMTSTTRTAVISIYAKAGGRSKFRLLMWTGAGSLGTSGGGGAEFDLTAKTATSYIPGGSFTVGAATIQELSNGWFRCSAAVTLQSVAFIYYAVSLSDGSSYSYAGDTSKGLYLWGAQAEFVTYQTAPRAYIPTTTAARFLPRFDTDPATLAARGLLIEGAAENLYFPSNTLTTTRASSGATVASSSITAPDGTTNSWLYTTTNATSVNYNSSYYTSAANQPNTASIFAKKGTARYVLVVLTRFADRYGVLFDLDTGNFVADFNTSTALTGKSYSSQNVGNGWYRLNVTGTGSDARTGINVGFTNTAAATVNASLDLTNADVGVTGYMFGFQIVQSATVSSYVPTSGASVTRAAETISAALYTTNPSIIQYRPIPAGTRARKIIDPFSGISSETNEWIESGAVYPMETGSAYLNTKLTVDGPY